MPINARPSECDGETILVVDDNVLLVSVLRRALERAKFKVVVAASGVEMMKVLYISQPDLIVLDIGLPDVDGRDLLASLKKDHKTYSIPVVVWSGQDPDRSRDIAIGLGAEDFVEKGPASTLVAKIQRILFRVSEQLMLA